MPILYKLINALQPNHLEFHTDLPCQSYSEIPKQSQRVKNNEDNFWRKDERKLTQKWRLIIKPYQGARWDNWNTVNSPEANLGFCVTTLFTTKQDLKTSGKSVGCFSQYLFFLNNNFVQTNCWQVGFGNTQVPSKRATCDNTLGSNFATPKKLQTGVHNFQ